MPNVVGALMSLPGIHHLTWLKTLNTSRRTTRPVPRGSLKFLYTPASMLLAPSVRYVLRPIKLSSVSPYTAWRKAPTGTLPLSDGLVMLPLQNFGSIQIGRLGFIPVPRKRMSGAPLSTIVYGVPEARRTSVETVQPPSAEPTQSFRFFSHGSE